MDNAQVLQTLREALSLTDNDMAEISRLAGREPDQGELTLPYFLEGFILYERGPRSDGAAVVVQDDQLSNNQILKKLRIAFNLQEIDMLSIFEEGGASLSVSEFGALFRKEGNKHFRPCSDVLLQNFLAGLTPSLDV